MTNWNRFRWMFIIRAINARLRHGRLLSCLWHCRAVSSEFINLSCTEKYYPYCML